MIEPSGAPAARDAPLIAVEHVCKRYGDQGFAVRDVSLAIARGELVAIVGDSGSGRTTLLKAINRLVEPDEGRVEVAGCSVRSMAPHALRRGIGYVFQQIFLFPHMTVGENIGATTPGDWGSGASRTLRSTRPS